MDPISTGLGGALLARPLPREKAGPAAVITVTAASLLPDADVVAEFFGGDELAMLSVHRGFSHSFFGAAVMAPVLALLVWRWGRDRNYLRLGSLALLGFLWHIFTDLCTAWGTMAYYPFSRARLAWDVLFIVDFVFTALLLFPHLLAWIYREPAGAGRRGAWTWLFLAALTAALVRFGSLIFGVPYPFALLLLLVTAAALLALPALRGWGWRQRSADFCRLGALALAAYLGVCAVAHQVALARVEEFSSSRGLKVEAQAALPQPLSPFRWSGLVQVRDGVYQAWLNVFDTSAPAFEFFPGARNEVTEQVRTLPAVQTYLWFARFPVARYREERGRRVVEYTDLRFRSPYRRTPFLFRVVLDAQGEVLCWGFF